MKKAITNTEYIRQRLMDNADGIELLKQYVASETGLQNGPMYAYSAGLHIYGYQEEIARIRAAKQLKPADGYEYDKS